MNRPPTRAEMSNMLNKTAFEILPLFRWLKWLSLFQYHSIYAYLLSPMVSSSSAFNSYHYRAIQTVCQVPTIGSQSQRRRRRMVTNQNDGGVDLYCQRTAIYSWAVGRKADYLASWKSTRYESTPHASDERNKGNDYGYQTRTTIADWPHRTFGHWIGLEQSRMFLIRYRNSELTLTDLRRLGITNWSLARDRKTRRRVAQNVMIRLGLQYVCMYVRRLFSDIWHDLLDHNNRRTKNLVYYSKNVKKRNIWLCLQKK